MEPEIDEVYQQFIYNKMINLDEDYVVQHYADKINYELLDEIKLQERREPLSFDIESILPKRIETSGWITPMIFYNSCFPRFMHFQVMLE